MFETAVKAIPAVEPIGEIEKACAACGYDHASPAIRVPGARIHGGDVENIPFDYFLCGGCGSLNIVDIPEDLGSYYDHGYYSFAPRLDQPGLKGKLFGLRNAILASGRGDLGGLVSRAFPYQSLLSMRPVFDGRLARLGKDAKILDLGCGSGLLLRQLRAAGYTDLTGADPFMKDELSAPGFRLIRGAAADLGGSYDVVMMHHAFEHVADPLAALDAIRGLLAPGGIVILRVPIVGGEAWRTYGGNWGQLDAPVHLWLFSDEGMEKLGDRAGFRMAMRLWDSNELQFTLSEMRVMGLSPHQGNVANERLAERVTPAQRKRFAKRAREMNRIGQGDQAAYYFTLS